MICTQLSIDKNCILEDLKMFSIIAANSRVESNSRCIRAKIRTSDQFVCSRWQWGWWRGDHTRWNLFPHVRGRWRGGQSGKRVRKCRTACWWEQSGRAWGKWQGAPETRIPLTLLGPDASSTDNSTSYPKLRRTVLTTPSCPFLLTYHYTHV